MASVVNFQSHSDSFSSETHRLSHTHTSFSLSADVFSLNFPLDGDIHSQSGYCLSDTNALNEDEGNAYHFGYLED